MRAFSAGDAVEHGLQAGRVQHAGGRHRLALPRDAAEVPGAPEADVGLRRVGQQLLEGLHPAHLDARALLQHLAHVARAELAVGMGIEAGVVEHVPALVRRVHDGGLLRHAERHGQAHHRHAAAGRARDEAAQRGGAGEREPALADRRLGAGDVQHDAHMVGPGARGLRHLAERVRADAGEHDVAHLQRPGQLGDGLGGQRRVDEVVCGVVAWLGNGGGAEGGGADRGDGAKAPRRGG